MQHVCTAVQRSIAALINTWMQKPCPQAYIQHMHCVITAVADREAQSTLSGLALPRMDAS
eukprot:122409-Rhodomonas_salina.1